MGSSRVFTDEDIEAMPRRPRFNVVDGEVRVVSPAHWRHEEILGYLTAEVVTFARRRSLGKVFTSNVLYRFASGNMYAPDLSFIAASRVGDLHDEATVKISPDLAVEVVSPDQARAVAEKLYEYTRAGVPLVWIIDPEQKTGLAAYQGRVISIAANGVLNGFDVLPGFSLALAQLFAEK